MAQSAKKRLKYADYTVAIVCALEVEMSAVRYMLDEEHELLPGREGDSNRYVLGAMSGHNVAIGCLPYGSQGIGAAATVATHMKRTFLAAKLLRLFVGIGGGVPSPSHDVRLGDVVVSMPDGQHGGVVQYDLGKETVAGFQRKGFLRPPPTIWRNAVVKMMSDQRVNDSRVPEFVAAMVQRHPNLSNYQSPNRDNDVLFRAKYKHVPKHTTCGKCDPGQSIERATRCSEHPVIHYGVIASGNQVIKNAVKRDRISRDAGGVLCFEMEAAGLMEDFECIVIRGIADYADSHKNDNWHAYAAATAAGCAKELLGYIDATVDRRPAAYHFVPNQRVKELLGREEELKKIQLAFSGGVTVEKPRIVILHAMGGQGKSQLALEYCRISSEVYDHIFWINAYSIATATRSFVNIADELKLATATDLEDNAKVRLVLQMLSRSERRCLVVFDNCDDPATFRQIRDFIPSRGPGDIIFTSRHEGLQRLGTMMGIPALSTPAAVQLLLRAYHNTDSDDYMPIASRIVNRLGGLALAIDQAASYIENYQLSIHQLEDFLRRYETERAKVLASTPFYSWEYGSTWMEKPDFEDAVSAFTTWEMSFHHFCKARAHQQQNLSNFLTISAYLAPTLIDEKIFRWHWERSDNHPEWLNLFVSEHEYDVEEDFDMYHNIEGDSQTITVESIDSSQSKRYTTWSQDTFWQVISQAKAFSLLQHANHDFEAEESSFSFHPLIRDWLQLRRRNRELRRGFSSSCISMLESSICAVEELGALTSFRGSLLLHVDTSIRTDEELSNRGQRIGEEIRSSQHAINFAEFYRQYGKLKLSSKLCRRARRTLEREYGMDDFGVLQAIDIEAKILVEKDDLKEAENLFRVTANAHERTSGISRNTLTAFGNLAGVIAYQGKYAEAERIQREITSLSAQGLGAKDPQVLENKANLANMLINQAKYEEGDSLLCETLDHQIEMFGRENAKTTWMKSLVAKSLACQGKKNQAEQLLREVSELQNRVHGPEHPVTLGSKHHLATILLREGKYDEAEQISRAVLELRILVLGSEHPKTVETKELVEDIPVVRCYFKQVASRHRVVLELESRARAFGSEHTELLRYKHSLEGMLGLQGGDEEVDQINRGVL